MPKILSMDAISFAAFTDLTSPSIESQTNRLLKNNRRRHAIRFEKLTSFYGSQADVLIAYQNAIRADVACPFPNFQSLFQMEACSRIQSRLCLRVLISENPAQHGADGWVQKFPELAFASLPFSQHAIFLNLNFSNKYFNSIVNVTFALECMDCVDALN